jgi:hypothetical protein
MSGLQTTLSCVTGASANVGQLVVIALLSVLVALHVATTIFSWRAAKSAEESANNTKHTKKPPERPATAVRAASTEGGETWGFDDPGACATACGEACAGSDRVAIPKTCARACAIACGFHLV